jgi:hypothetical protein
MDEKPLQPHDRPAAPAGSRGRPSALAVVALIVAAIPLCPLTGFVGALLGVVALRRIRLAGGRLGGRGVATWAIVIGVAFAFIWLAVLDTVLQKQREAQEAMMINAVGAAMRSGQTADPAGALQVWSVSDPDRPSGGEIVGFGEEAAGRYGAFDRFSMIAVSSRGSFWRSTVEIAGMFHFADEAPLGSASFVLETPPGRIMPVFRLTRLMIEDGQRGDLILGPFAAEDDPAAEP